jgi:hypothetical protein
VVMALIRWRRTSTATKALLASPALALAPFIVYGSFTYYPRHEVTGYVLMGTVLAIGAVLERHQVAAAWLRAQPLARLGHGPGARPPALPRTRRLRRR